MTSGSDAIVDLDLAVNGHKVVDHLRRVVDSAERTHGLDLEVVEMLEEVLSVFVQPVAESLVAERAEVVRRLRTRFVTCGGLRSLWRMRNWRSS